jgi:myo-inositol 2-dehydrogenase/D-chiro-inositol 1-dehydrogenase
LNRYAAYGYDQRCEIFGDKGKVNVGNEFETTTVVSTTGGDHWSRLKNSYDTRFHDAFSNELNAFADTVLMNNPWPVGKDDIIVVQQVAAAAKKYFETNQIVNLSTAVEK